jgi:hypothetical protein
MIGTWTTYAPLGSERLRQHRMALEAMRERIVKDAPLIVIDEMVVYIEGVKWEWQRLEVKAHG